MESTRNPYDFQDDLHDVSISQDVTVDFLNDELETISEINHNQCTSHSHGSSGRALNKSLIEAEFLQAQGSCNCVDVTCADIMIHECIVDKVKWCVDITAGERIEDAIRDFDDIHCSCLFDRSNGVSSENVSLLKEDGVETLTEGSHEAPFGVNLREITDREEVCEFVLAGIVKMACNTVDGCTSESDGSLFTEITESTAGVGGLIGNLQTTDEEFKKNYETLETADKECGKFEDARHDRSAVNLFDEGGIFKGFDHSTESSDGNDVKQSRQDGDCTSAIFMPPCWVNTPYIDKCNSTFQTKDACQSGYTDSATSIANFPTFSIDKSLTTAKPIDDYLIETEYHGLDCKCFLCVGECSKSEPSEPTDQGQRVIRQSGVNSTVDSSVVSETTTNMHSHVTSDSKASVGASIKGKPARSTTSMGSNSTTKSIKSSRNSANTIRPNTRSMDRSCKVRAVRLNGIKTAQRDARSSNGRGRKTQRPKKANVAEQCVLWKPQIGISAPKRANESLDQRQESKKRKK